MKHLLLILIYKGLMPLFLRLIGVKIVPKKPLQPNAQYIIVANHNSHIDTMALMSSIPTKDLKRTHPVAAATYFGKNSWLAVLSKLFVNTILIKRSEEGGESTALDVLDHYLSKGHSLIIFPEGSRGEPEKMQAFRKGIGVLLQRNPQVPFVPVYIQGTGKILPKGERLIVPYDAQLIFGPARHTSFTQVAEIVDEIKRAILDLKS
ncbi:MAG: 1-acyl-sn-glycerol-3-phosphate acyltransferase [Crocinitomicaceae bacterium]|nr:1-acyl-sn-glycerol-3-phosphate acyltransferase [Crocinitomicaceae bacterium]MDP4739735.1 1-acyl-sn-glycerol-3-phosphate acyltransferase [Crocinitomicaceae bacterium]MDP4799480.1 1-acyl-sn-glycerol-3-phosphate acyltransferase [Crocinitomicaceae bacterium]MDP4806295.1 1-acyl-sn-glycerol-3-phosphate acyltransferase [Crocinitomicaceae bacterium]MDP4869000.1 1-acyl-sn-glycerol-3-phosphate acyltransferase [Crocinitomicaceae bacterium]